jgi:hypothetical protein
MPIYHPPRKGVSISEAYAEAALSAPVSRAMLRCYELWHPTLPDGPIRIVHDFAPFFATLEANAPRDAGVEVEFLAGWLEAGIFEESDEAASPQVEVKIDNVSGLLSDALRNARGSIVPWEFIERVYASDDPSGPAQLPVLSLTFTLAKIAGATATLTMSFGDPVNMNVPRLTFKPEEYPALAP